ncbi:hypothetical protein AAEU33_05475 [Chryseobacterium sp. Chry.R1]|uniref:hypothetical protein n=1 Tax=Chryseobacterium sp. Chry.R1 TaxID=3139392 RepID=UPI0031F7D3DE
MKDIKNNSEENKSVIRQQPPKRNLFQGKTEAEKEKAKFSNWDILPPHQLINPRIKSN